MALSNITELESAIERTKLQSSNLFISCLSPVEKLVLKGIYETQIIIYQTALDRLKGANEIEVIYPEFVSK